MIIERLQKLLFALSVFIIIPQFIHASNPGNKNNNETQSILNRLEATVKENIKMMAPTLKLELPAIEDRLEDAYTNFFDEMINGAHKFLGTPYRSGGKTPKGFDCSGFTSYIFSRYGVKLSSSSRSQINDGKKIAREDVKKGDLIFFKGSNSSSMNIGHVGIISDADDKGNIKFIHSASRGGVIVSNLKEPYYARRYVASVRIKPSIFNLKQ